MKNLFALCLIGLSLVACSNDKSDETVSHQENTVIQQREAVQEATTALTNAEQEELADLLREADDFGSVFSDRYDVAKYIQAIQNERLLSLLKRSCDTGNKEHCFTYAMLPFMPEFMEVSNKFMQGDKSQAPRMLAIVDKMCDVGSAHMCLMSAKEFYLHGFQDDHGNMLTQKDETKAISLMEKACYAEIDTKENACYALSKIYKNGEIIPQDLAKAEDFYQRAEQLKSERIKKQEQEEERLLSEIRRLHLEIVKIEEQQQSAIDQLYSELKKIEEQRQAEQQSSETRIAEKLQLDIEERLSEIRKREEQLGTELEPLLLEMGKRTEQLISEMRKREVQQGTELEQLQSEMRKRQKQQETKFRSEIRRKRQEQQQAEQRKSEIKKRQEQKLPEQYRSEMRKAEQVRSEMEQRKSEMEQQKSEIRKRAEQQRLEIEQQKSEIRRKYGLE